MGSHVAQHQQIQLIIGEKLNYGCCFDDLLNVVGEGFLVTFRRGPFFFLFVAQVCIYGIDVVHQENHVWRNVAKVGEFVEVGGDPFLGEDLNDLLDGAHCMVFTL